MSERSEGVADRLRRLWDGLLAVQIVERNCAGTQFLVTDGDVVSLCRMEYPTVTCTPPILRGNLRYGLGMLEGGLGE